MTVEYSNKFNWLKEVQRKLDVIELNVSKGLTLELSKAKKDLASGRGFDGRALRAYAESTKKSKKRRGRKTTPVTLRESGVTIGSLQIKVQRAKNLIIGLVYTTNPTVPRSKINTATNISYQNKLRPNAIGLGKKAIDRIRATIKKALTN